MTVFPWMGSIPFEDLKVGMRVVSGHTYWCGSISYLEDWTPPPGPRHRTDQYGQIIISWDHGSKSIFWYEDDYEVPMIFVMTPVYRSIT